MAGWRAIRLDKLSNAKPGRAEVGHQCIVHDALIAADLLWAAGEHAEVESATTDFWLGKIKSHQIRGGVSVRENLANSAVWDAKAERAMWERGTWWDKKYATCTLQSARHSRRNLRHDIEEIKLWPDMDCHHTHDPEEWESKHTAENKIYDPSREEDEYTACLCFHVVRAVSMWAVRVGRAKPRIPRQPPVETEGDRVAWLQWDHRAFREWAMLPMGMVLGLDLKTVGAVSKDQTIPRREQITGAYFGQLHQDEIYVGAGHHSHKQKCTKWASPFIEGQHGTAKECKLLYVNHLHESGLLIDIMELADKKLLCECEQEEQCIADILIAEVYSKRHGGWWQPKTLGMLAATGGDAWVAWTQMRKEFRRKPPRHRLYKVPQVRWQQESVVRAFASMFPLEFFQGFRFPMIEDIVNGQAFTRYMDWRDGQDYAEGSSLPPAFISRSAARKARGGAGIQLGAMMHKAALPPLVSFGLPAEEHFQRALQRAAKPSPLEVPISLDNDLVFAADMMCTCRDELSEIRQEAITAMKMLKYRWRSVTSRLRKMQGLELRGVTAKRDIGLITLLIVLLAWPDKSFGRNLVRGFPAVGHGEWSGVYPWRGIPSEERKDIFAGAEDHNRHLIASLRPGPNDQVILLKSMQDVDNHFATPPMTHEMLMKSLNGEKYRLIKRFVITQSTGKQRIIDDAAAGGQSEVSTDENALQFCTAVQPACHIAVLYSRLKANGLEWPEGVNLLSAGEDWPDAYRYTPMRQDEARACIVTWWHPVWQQPVFQRYFGLLFGLPLAVTSFNRWSKLSEAIARRILVVLFSMYFDDGTLQEWEDSAVSCQEQLKELMELLGSPWAQAKTQRAAVEGDFLGLQHDLAQVSSGVIRFWPRETLIEKVDTIVELALQVGLPSGQASKLYGVTNFLETGMYGRIGRAGLDAIKCRQYEQEFTMSEEIKQTLGLIQSLFKMQPRREFILFQRVVKRILVASDASYEASVGNAGFLMVTYPGQADRESRQGREIIVPEELFNYWGPQETYIAQLELMAVLVVMVELASEVRDSRGLWFIDNSAALMALVHGKSGSHSLDKMAKFVHLANFALRTNPYYEYVESKANWSDEISRQGLDGTWAKENGFTLARCSFMYQLLDLPCEAVVILFSFL